MVRFALLASATVGSDTLVTRMRACVVAGLVTFHECVPSFGVLAMTIGHVPSRHVSIRCLGVLRTSAEPRTSSAVRGMLEIPCNCQAENP